MTIHPAKLITKIIPAKTLLGVFFLFTLTACESIHIAKEEAARDQLIVRHVKHALFKNEIVPKSGHFGVSAKKGVVLLTGSADSSEQMNAAISIAKRSQGVVGIENEITIAENVEGYVNNGALNDAEEDI